MQYVHVDQNDTEGPYIGGTGLIHGSHVISALCETKCIEIRDVGITRMERTIAHIRRTTTIHVRRDSIPSRQSKIREFDDDLAFPDAVFIEYPAISDNEILWLDVTMKDGSVMARGYSLAHLGKHRGNKAETGGR